MMSNSTIRLFRDPAQEAIDPFNVSPEPTGLDFESGIPQPVPADSPGIVLEPVHHDSQLKLLIMDRESGLEIRINDQKIGPLGLIGSRDRFRIGLGPTFEMAIFHRVSIGPPTTDQLGSRCPICLDAFEESSRVLCCPCGSAFHLQPDGDPPLECATTLTNCPKCQRPVQLEEGYQNAPDFLIA